MEGLVVEKYHKHWNIGIISFVILLVIVSVFHKSGEKVNYEEELNSEYSGRVINKYIDSLDHSICKLIFKSGKTVSVWNNCYEKVSLGDSIVKKKGNFNFIIYKQSGTLIVNIENNLIIPNK